MLDADDPAAWIDQALALSDAQDGDTFYLQIEQLAAMDGDLAQAVARLTLARSAEFPAFRADLLAAVRTRRTAQDRPCQCGSGQPWQTCTGNPDQPGGCG
jgi:hypothetical protein